MKDVKLFLWLFICFVGWTKSDKNLKTKQGCTGPIGFSSSGINKAHSSGLLQYKTNIYDSNHGWNRDTGTFTVKCPGVYSVSFSAYGAPDTRFTLKKRTISNELIPVISTASGGGSNSIVILLNTAEQIFLTVVGNLRNNLEQSLPVNSFTVYKINNSE